MKKLKQSLAPFYLGFALSYFGNLKIYNWEFYAIIIPFYILVLATNFNKED